MNHQPLSAAFAAALWLLTLGAARAEPGSCEAGQDDREERPTPDAVLPRLAQTFGVAADVLRGGSYIRCAGGKLLGCEVGANLNCGKADMSRRSKGGEAFCRDNLDADSVPMSATGHDTVYEWRCVGRHAVPGKIVEDVDGLGFTSRNWREVR